MQVAAQMGAVTLKLIADLQSVHENPADAIFRQLFLDVGGAGRALLRLRAFPADLDVVQDNIALDGGHHHAQKGAEAGAGKVGGRLDFGGRHLQVAINLRALEEQAATNLHTLQIQIPFQVRSGETDQPGGDEPAQDRAAALVGVRPFLQLDVVAAQTAVNLRLLHEQGALNLRLVEDDLAGELGPAHEQ